MTIFGGVYRGGNRRLDASNYFATRQDVGNMEVLNHCDKILGVICFGTLLWKKGNYRGNGTILTVFWQNYI